MDDALNAAQVAGYLKILKMIISVFLLFFSLTVKKIFNFFPRKKMNTRVWTLIYFIRLAEEENDQKSRI